jgi:Domain of unknown function (DUF927)
MAKPTTNKIKLRKRGAVQRTTTAAGEDKWVRVAPRIKLRAIGTRVDGTHLAEIRFRPLKGKIRSEFVEWSLMITEKKTELKAKLAALGYDWPKDKATSDAVWAAVVGTRPKNEFLSVNTPGWHRNGFVLPGKFFCSDPTAVPVVIDPNSVEHVGAFLSGEGDLSDWQRTVGRLAQKSSPLRVAISAALAAPLLRKLNMDSFAINWFGQTSEGKSFLLKVGASVSGLIGPDGLPGWADTEAAFEGQAMGHRDCMMPLDETADGEHKMSLDQKARMLAFVIARNRPRRFSKGYEKQHGLQNREYRIVVQSSSERALRDIARDAGKQRLGGEEVRFTDVPASEPGSQGIFDGNIKQTDGTALSEITKGWVEDTATAARRYQGHVLPAFLDKLTRDKNWEATVRKYREQFETDVETKDLKAIYRIRSNFALIWAAGALAIDYGVLPWKKSRLLKAVKKCFERAVGALQKPEAVEAAGLAQNASDDLLKTLKKKLAQCKLCPVKPRKKVSEQEVEQRRDADGFIIDGATYLKQDRVKAWFPDKSSRTALRRTGVFHATRPDTSTVSKKITGIAGKPRYYAINASALERSA